MQTQNNVDMGESDQPPRAKENIAPFGVRIWQWIYVEFIWHPGIWTHDRNHIVTTNAQNNYILFEFCPSITTE